MPLGWLCVEIGSIAPNVIVLLSHACQDGILPEPLELYPAANSRVSPVIHIPETDIHLYVKNRRFLHWHAQVFSQLDLHLVAGAHVHFLALLDAKNGYAYGHADAGAYHGRFGLANFGAAAAGGRAGTTG